jgi:hypothetical protein
LEYEDIYKDVLVLFSINKKIFDSSFTIDIFLQILESFLIGSKNYLKKEEKELISNYIIIQETTVIQFLLELCINNSQNKVDLVLKRQKICQFIHQRFIENPLLAKIIHIQTYDINLLPITINGIESIRFYLFKF